MKDDAKHTPNRPRGTNRSEGAGRSLDEIAEVVAAHRREMAQELMRARPEVRELVEAARACLVDDNAIPHPFAALVSWEAMNRLRRALVPFEKETP